MRELTEEEVQNVSGGDQATAYEAAGGAIAGAGFATGDPLAIAVGAGILVAGIYMDYFE